MTLTPRVVVFGAALAVLATLAPWRPTAVAQTVRSDDVLPALLQEVHGLRAAMEQMASGSTQAQVLIGRLQLQEGRVTSMIRRPAPGRDSLSNARREYEQIQGAMRMLGKDEQPGAPDDKDAD